MQYPGRYPRVKKSSLSPFWATGGIGPTHGGDLGDVADACGVTPAGVRSTGTVWVPGIAGPALSVVSTNGASFTPVLPAGTTSATWGSLVRRYDQTPASGFTTGLCDFGGAGAQGTHYPWIDGAFYCGILDTSSRPISYIPPGGFDFTTWHWLHIISTPGPGGYKLYVDGVLATTATRGALGLLATSTMGVSQTNYQFNGEFSHTRMYARGLSDAEIAHDVRYPNHIYEADRSRRRAYASHATATTRNHGIFTGGAYNFGIRTGGGL
jgi:hypothetical protein